MNRQCRPHLPEACLPQSSMIEGASILVIETLKRRLHELEKDLTVGNYFDRIDEINRIKLQLNTYSHDNY